MFSNDIVLIAVCGALAYIVLENTIRTRQQQQLLKGVAHDNMQLRLYILDLLQEEKL